MNFVTNYAAGAGSIARPVVFYPEAWLQSTLDKQDWGVYITCNASFQIIYRPQNWIKKQLELVFNTDIINKTHAKSTWTYGGGNNMRRKSGVAPLNDLLDVVVLEELTDHRSSLQGFESHPGNQVIQLCWDIWRKNIVLYSVDTWFS